MNDEIKTTLAHPAVQAGWCDGCSPDNCGGCATPAAPAQVGKYPELPEWSKRDDLGGLVPSEVRQALRAYADETCEARAAAASKPQVKEARERRRWLSDSFNRGTQTLDEATVSARAMAASMERQGVLLRAPAQAAALVTPSDDGFMAAVNEMDGLYAAPLAITSAPERIWLDLGFNPYENDVHFSHLHDLTWSQNNATGDGIEYVRADLAARKPLADSELHALYAAVMSGPYTNALHYWIGTHGHRFARAIEQAHGIKATNPESNK